MTFTLNGRSIAAFAAGLALAISGLFVFQAIQADATGDDEASFAPITPCRLFDTRPAPDNVGPRATPLGAGETYALQVTGENGNCTIPAEATAVAMNVTAVGATAPSFLQLWPADAAKPTLGSNLNYLPGQPPTPNKVDVKLSPDGMVKLFNAFGSVDVLGDVVGYYTKGALNDLDARVSKHNLLGPAKVTATTGATEAAARDAAPETKLFKQGSIEIYAKCFLADDTGQLRGEMYVRTDTDGAMMEGSDDLPGTNGDTFLNVATPEADRQLDTESATLDTASYNESEGAITSADGRMYSALTTVGAKLGSPSGGNGPFGDGDVCMFGGLISG